jgi:acetylornithine deacetylase/succinyl-diaminopimelate desuccinylase-like protein
MDRSRARWSVPSEAIRWAPQPPGIRSAARLPVIWASVLVGNGKHSSQRPVQVVTHGVRKLIKYMKVNSVCVRRPHIGTVRQAVNGVKHLHAEGIRCNGAAFKIPEECLVELPLRLGQDLDDEARHMALMRARTSDQGVACTRPARSSARRCSSSARQAPATALSSLVSRLSISAAATAERSSAESRSTSSSTRSMRAVMAQSIALGPPTAAPRACSKRAATTSLGLFRRRPLGPRIRTGKPTSRRPTCRPADPGRRAQTTDSRPGAKEIPWTA